MLNEPGGAPAQPPNPLPTAYWRWILTPGLVGSALVGQDVPRGGHAVCPQSLLSPVRLDPGGGGDGQTTAQQTSGQQHAGNHLDYPDDSHCFHGSRRGHWFLLLQFIFNTFHSHFCSFLKHRNDSLRREQSQQSGGSRLKQWSPRRLQKSEWERNLARRREKAAFYYINKRIRFSSTMTGEKAFVRGSQQGLSYHLDISVH